MTINKLSSAILVFMLVLLCVSTGYTSEKIYVGGGIHFGEEIYFEKSFGNERYLYSVPVETASAVGIRTSNYPMELTRVFNAPSNKTWNSILKVIKMLRGTIIVEDVSGLIVFKYTEKVYVKDYGGSAFQSAEIIQNLQNKGLFFHPYKKKDIIYRDRPVAAQILLGAVGLGWDYIEYINFDIYINIFLKKAETNNATTVHLTYFIPFLEIPYKKYVEFDFFETLENILKEEE